jgi:hypothetical protein
MSGHDVQTTRPQPNPQPRDPSKKLLEKNTLGSYTDIMPLSDRILDCSRAGAFATNFLLPANLSSPSHARLIPSHDLPPQGRPLSFPPFENLLLELHFMAMAHKISWANIHRLGSAKLPRIRRGTSRDGKLAEGKEYPVLFNYYVGSGKQVSLLCLDFGFAVCLDAL